MKAINIEELIKALKTLKEQGVEEVQVEGTIMAEDMGNLILVSTERQM